MESKRVYKSSSKPLRSEMIIISQLNKRLRCLPQVYFHNPRNVRPTYKINNDKQAKFHLKMSGLRATFALPKGVVKALFALLFMTATLHAQEIRRAWLPNDKPSVYILKWKGIPAGIPMTYIECTANTDKNLEQCLTKLADSARMVQGNVIVNVQPFVAESGVPGLRGAIYRCPHLIWLARSGWDYEAF